MRLRHKSTTIVEDSTKSGPNAKRATTSLKRPLLLSSCIHLKIKAMRFAIKGAKFNPDDMKSFEEIYTNVENSCAVLRDMDELVQEQGMGELPAGFKSLDLDYAAGSMPADKALSTRMTDRDIDEITDRLDKLHILQAVAERVFKRIKTAEVTSVARGYTEPWICYSGANSNTRAVSSIHCN